MPENAYVQIFNCNETLIQAFNETIKYWSNGIGELHKQGVSITEDDLPLPLRRAYEELWFESGTTSSANCYLVETPKGFGIALCYEYDECFADDCDLSMDELFNSALMDLNAIRIKPEFQNAEIYLGEYMGFNESHELVVVFPADTPRAEFEQAAKLLDELTFNDARENNLSHYVVTVTETFQRTVVIYAKDNYHAEEQAEELCNNSVIDLTGHDFVSRSCSCDGAASKEDLKGYKVFNAPGVRSNEFDLNAALAAAKANAKQSERSPSKADISIDK